MARNRDLSQHVVTVRIQNALIYSGLLKGDSDVLGSAIWEYFQEVGSGGSGQQVLRSFRQKNITVIDSGKSSFRDFVSGSDEFVKCDSKHALVNMFVDRLVNNANPKFWINDRDVLAKIFFHCIIFMFY